MTKKGHLHVVPEGDFYQVMRKKVRDWAEDKGRGHKYLELILLAPDMLHLLTKLTLDERVPWKSKAKLGVAIAYFISPIDLLPEAVLGPAGYLDDIAVAAWVLDDLIKTSGPEVVLEHWAGEADLLAVIARIIAGANELLGSGLARRLKKIVDRQENGKFIKQVGPARKLPPPHEDEKD